ncbi:restriction endonuclease subunit S [Aliarcobacter butzleri]|uniref:restriction endonuclease subunit S n=1 Tax=Aliarcobacter butzleri TaxID=28197 RepID=UPI003B21EE3A
MSKKELEFKNDLPSGWAETLLENIVFILDNQRVPVSAVERTKRLEKCSNENVVPYYGATGQAGVIDDYLFDEELILLGEDGVPFYDNNKHKAYIINGKSWVNNHAHVLKSINPYVDSKYILHYLNIFDYHGYVTGTTRLKLNQQSMKKIPIQLPTQNEQKRIVTKIEKLFSNLDNSDKYLLHLEKQLKRYRQSVLKSAFEGEITKEWREKNNIKFEWEFKKFYEIIKLIDGDRGKNYPKQTDYFNVGYCLYLSTKNVRPFGFNFDEQVYITQEKHEMLRSGTLSVGDVVLTTRGTIGNVAYYDKNIPFPVVRINSGMLILRIMNDVKLTPSFLMKYIQSPSFDTQRKEKVSGTAQPQLPVGTLKDFNIPLPNTFEEQLEIVNQIEKHFSIIDKLEAVVQQSIKESKRLRQSILKQAFEGKLVEQDPNDESASVLLEKIAKAKEEYQKAQKKQARKK